MGYLGHWVTPCFRKLGSPYGGREVLSSPREGSLSLVASQRPMSWRESTGFPVLWVGNHRFFLLGNCWPLCAYSVYLNINIYIVVGFSSEWTTFEHSVYAWWSHPFLVLRFCSKLTSKYMFPRFIPNSIILMPYWWTNSFYPIKIINVAWMIAFQHVSTSPNGGSCQYHIHSITTIPWCSPLEVAVAMVAPVNAVRLYSADAWQGAWTGEAVCDMVEWFQTLTTYWQACPFSFACMTNYVLLVDHEHDLYVLGNFRVKSDWL